MHLPSFLEALASIVKEMGDVGLIYCMSSVHPPCRIVRDSYCEFCIDLVIVHAYYYASLAIMSFWAEFILICTYIV